MSKEVIKPVVGIRFYRPLTLKFVHIGPNSASRSYCGAKVGPMSQIGYPSEVDKETVCPKCIKNTNSWEVVESQEPDVLAAFHLPDGTTINVNGVEYVPRVCNECGKEIDPGRTLSCPECYEVIKKEQPDLAKVADQYMIDQYKMICDMYTMPYGEGDCDTTAYDQSRMYLDIDFELRAEVERIVEENERRIKKNVELSHELVRLKDAVNGHTLESIREIMKAAPPADDLDGHTLEYCKDNQGRREYWNFTLRSWSDLVSHNWQRNHDQLYRTPIVEYIEGDEITDELVQLYGRLPCEIRGEGSDEWVKQGLLVSVDDPSTGFDSATYWTRYNGIMVGWNSCRIKKSDLEVSE